MPHIKRGLLIAIEGIDGSGKTTLKQNICDVLSNEAFDILPTKEPGGTSCGEDIIAILQDDSLDHKTVFLLFAADRAQHFSELIIPALHEKKIVISDRLADSSLAYQGYGRDIDKTFIKTINAWIMHNIKPDITIYVRIPVHDAIKRLKKRSFTSVFEEASFLERVAQGFETMYSNNSLTENIIILNGLESKEFLTHQAIIGIKQWIQKNNLLL